MSSKQAQEAQQIQAFTKKFQGLAEDLKQLKNLEGQPETIEQIRELALIADNLVHFVRETYQESIEQKIENLIQALTRGKGTPEDLQLLEEVCVGDAQSYISAQKLYPSWVQLLGEYCQSLNELSEKREQPEYLLQAYGKAIALNRLLKELNFYAQQNKRIEAFRNSIADGIDYQEARTWVDTLRFKLDNLNA